VPDGVRYFAGRAVACAATVAVVSILVFAGVHLMPGSYADIVLGPYSAPEARAQLGADYGLDRPLPVQYWEWVGQAAGGNFGTSLHSGVPVADIIKDRLPVTFELTLLATIIVLIVGIPLAVAAGIARRHLSRSASRLGGALAMSTPDFVLGSVIVYLFSRYSLGLPVDAYVPFSQDPAESVRSLILPAFTLSVFGIALMVRTGRDAIAGVASAPHVVAALARGETRSHIIRHHVLRNASIPLITALTIYIGHMMGGAVIVESLFSLPGLGQAVLQGVSGRDYAVVQGAVLVAATTFIVLNLMADFAYGVIDPRIRRPGER
jgi:peptide/nickel transport system permease protein